MTLSLDIKGVYRAKADLVEISLFVLDTKTKNEKSHPELIASGAAHLFSHNPRQRIGLLYFDRYNGNADGSIRIFFLHPISLNDLTFDLEVVTIDGITLSVTSKPVKFPDKPSKLAEQPPLSKPKPLPTRDVPDPEEMHLLDQSTKSIRT